MLQDLIETETVRETTEIGQLRTYLDYVIDTVLDCQEKLTRGAKTPTQVAKHFISAVNFEKRLSSSPLKSLFITRTPDQLAHIKNGAAIIPSESEL